jgi:hypothetical protein
VCLGNAVSLSCGETGQAPENLEVWEDSGEETAGLPSPQCPEGV